MTASAKRPGRKRKFCAARGGIQWERRSIGTRRRYFMGGLRNWSGFLKMRAALMGRRPPETRRTTTATHPVVREKYKPISHGAPGAFADDEENDGQRNKNSDADRACKLLDYLMRNGAQVVLSRFALRRGGLLLIALQPLDGQPPNPNIFANGDFCVPPTTGAGFRGSPKRIEPRRHTLPGHRG